MQMGCWVIVLAPAKKIAEQAGKQALHAIYPCYDSWNPGKMLPLPQKSCRKIKKLI